MSQHSATRDLKHSKALMDVKNYVDDRVKGAMGVPSDEPPGETRFRQDLDAMKSSLQELQKFTEKHADCDNRMASYLEDLDAARPVEGQTVI